MRAALRSLDGILHGQPPTLGANQPRVASTAQLVLLLCFLGALYGACMGSFSLTGSGSGHALQIVASALKVPALFFLTLVVTLPSLYVFNALLGTRLTAGPLVHLMLSALGVTIAVLASIGPIVAFFGVSSTSYSFIVLLNVAVFGLSGALGLRHLRSALANSSAEGPKPIGRIFWIWMGVFGFVGMQMAWLLRPFIGSPRGAFTWFRPQHGNFFESVAMHFMKLIHG